MTNPRVHRKHGHASARQCFLGTPLSPAAQWRFPAADVVVKYGVPECDALADAIRAVEACAALPASERLSATRRWVLLSGTMASAPRDRRAAVGPSCKPVDDVVRRNLAAAGCKI